MKKNNKLTKKAKLKILCQIEESMAEGIVDPNFIKDVNNLRINTTKIKALMNEIYYRWSLFANQKQKDTARSELLVKTHKCEKELWDDYKDAFRPLDKVNVVKTILKVYELQMQLNGLNVVQEKHEHNTTNLQINNLTVETKEKLKNIIEMQSDLQNSLQGA